MNMITAKEAVVAAMSYLGSVSLEGTKISEVRVEEVTSTMGYWVITLSYEVTGQYAFQRERDYKEFRVSEENGIVESMKIWKPERLKDA